MNTDQFDGHTPGPWDRTTRKGTWVVYTQDNGDVATMNDYEDAKLIAAAPDLLAEVKRLKKRIERAVTFLRSDLKSDEHYDYYTHEEVADIFYGQKWVAADILEGKD